MQHEDEQPKWPHIENHYQHPDYLVAGDWYTITEKIHGMNARFGMTTDGTFWFGGRNHVLWEGLPDIEKLTKDTNMQGFGEAAFAMEESISTGFTFFGEWAGPGIQKGVDYGDEKRFFLFGIMQYDPNTFKSHLLPWPDIEQWSDLLGCETVPLLWDGPLSQPILSEMSTWATQPSGVSPNGDEREGIVITAWPPRYDAYGHLLILKMKNPSFEERKSKSNRLPKGEPIDLTQVQGFVEEFATLERLMHVLQQVEEKTAANPLHAEHTGLILRTYYEDVLREGATEYEALGPDNQKQVSKTLNRAVKPMLETYRNNISLA